MSRQHLTPGKDPVPIVQEAGWASGPVWTGAENLAPTGIRSPGRPARRLHCIAPQGSPHTPTARIAATTPRLIVRILNSVFLKTFRNFQLLSNFNEVQTYSLMMIC